MIMVDISEHVHKFLLIVVEFSTGNVDNAMGMVSSNKKAGKGKLDIDQLDIPGVSEKCIAV